jgi:hypothetical protein
MLEQMDKGKERKGCRVARSARDMGKGSIRKGPKTSFREGI